MYRKFFGIIIAVLCLGACGGLPDVGVPSALLRTFSGGRARLNLNGLRAPLNEKAPVRPERPQAILFRQEAVYGLPGFGDNSFPAMYGAYYLETPEAPLPEEEAAGAPAAEGNAGGPPAFTRPPDFSLWVSPMDMYYEAGLWTALPSINNLEAREQASEGQRLIALTLERSGGLWTVVFGFSGGPGALDPREQGRIIAAWTARFSYFLSLRRVESDVSLPAVLGL
jgi:hypothetical protein